MRTYNCLLLLINTIAMKSKYLLLLLFTICVLGYSCSPKSSKSYNKLENNTRNSFEVDDRNKTLSLKDRLIRMPKLVWTNGRIMLKENASIVSQREPLYIFDGIKVRNSYSKIDAIIDANDIKSIRVLTSVSETSIYGLDGNNGVVLIKSKDK